MLVIIGLLFGGVLVGQDLIYASHIRSQISQTQGIETQINTFKEKYNCTAGDCANATEVFGTTDTYGNIVNNGNGDGIIKSIYGNDGLTNPDGECIWANITGEVSAVFQELFLAGISKDYTTGKLNISSSVIGKEYPYSAFGNGTGVIVSCMATLGWGGRLTPSFLRQGNIIVIGITASGTARIGYSTGQFGVVHGGGLAEYGSYNTSLPPYPIIGIPADVARRIDEKIDDGKPSSGKFGIIAGQAMCDNTLASYNQTQLLTAYPAPTVSCNVTAGKKID